MPELPLRITRRIRRWSAVEPLHRVLLVAGAAGLVVGCIGIATGGATFGTGYEQARAAVEGTPPSAGFFLAKLAASLASTVSGIPGGLFAPSLSVGAGLGSTIGMLMDADIGLAAVVGMATLTMQGAAVAQQTDDRYQSCIPSTGHVRSDAGEGNTGYRKICSTKPGETQSRCYQTGDGSVVCEPGRG